MGKLSVCRLCYRKIHPNTGVGPKGSRVCERCSQAIPVDLIIFRGSSRIELKTSLMSKRQLQKVARLYITQYSGKEGVPCPLVLPKMK